MIDYNKRKRGDTIDTLKVIKKRRSIRTCQKDKNVDVNVLKSHIESAILSSPTAFNGQGSKVLLLLEGAHDTLWDLTLETVLKETNDSQKVKTKAKMAQFKNATGTVLFFEDKDLEAKQKEKFPFVKDQVHDWAMQSNGMLQYAIWLLLEDMGYKASLQHYNPLIDDHVQETFAVEPNFRLVAQMPFGPSKETPGEKKQIPLDKRFKVINKA